MSEKVSSWFIAVCGLLLLAALVRPVAAQIAFEDATAGSGILHDGESYGVSWGDLNADGWPDLFVNNQLFCLFYFSGIKICWGISVAGFTSDKFRFLLSTAISFSLRLSCLTCA